MDDYRTEADFDATYIDWDVTAEQERKRKAARIRKTKVIAKGKLVRL